MDTTTPVLSIRDLHKRHGDREVLKGVSLDVLPGSVAVLIGPSGGGKSTVLRCINGLDDFHGGEIDIAGQRLTAQQSYRERQHVLQTVRQRVGMVFQQFHLFPHMNVLENVIEAPMHVLKKSKAVAVQEGTLILDRVGLGDRLDSMPGQLSGGQQQRVAIARALAMRPSVMLFDEPTSALDPQMTAEVLAVMSDLARQGQTMMVVTHAMGFARRAAHQVFLMSNGVIAESGPPEQVLGNPQEAVTREFLREMANG